jgi:hypothetical protein
MPAIITTFLSFIKHIDRAFNRIIAICHSMCKNINYSLFILMNRLPDDIIMNHIIPYTYSTQPVSLQEDIHDFKTSFPQIIQIYTGIYGTRYGLNLLHLDIIRFTSPPRVLYDVMKRHFNLRNASSQRIHQIIIGFRNVYRKTKMIWGLLTPRERTHFFNEYTLPRLV